MAENQRAEALTQTLPLLPLTEGVILPHMSVTVSLEDPVARAAIEAARAGDGRLLLVPRAGSGFAPVGTVARIEDSGRLPNGTEVSVVRGLHRGNVVGDDPARAGAAGEGLWMEITPHYEPEIPSERASELARQYRAVLETLLEARGVPGMPRFLRGISKPGHLADISGYSAELSFEQKTEILTTLDVEERLEKLIKWTQDALAEQSIKKKIQSDVNEGLEKTQREFLLRQQLAAIRKELGEDGDDDLIETYRQRLADEKIPEPVR
ncbi:MAG: LON peptidase substrate-binding domain-containing protein, partial [Actinomycetota bacterium]